MKRAMEGDTSTMARAVKRAREEESFLKGAEE